MGLGSQEITLLLLFVVFVAAVAGLILIAVRSRSKSDLRDLEVLALVADRSGGHPACPNCRSLSFHPVPARTQSAGALVLGIFAFGSVYAGEPTGVVACTVCGRRFLQR